MGAGSGGDHRTRLRQELLTRMFDENVMELLLVIAQHAHAVRSLPCAQFLFFTTSASSTVCVRDYRLASLFTKALYTKAQRKYSKEV